MKTYKLQTRNWLEGDPGKFDADEQENAYDEDMRECATWPTPEGRDPDLVCSRLEQVTPSGKKADTLNVIMLDIDLPLQIQKPADRWVIMFNQNLEANPLSAEDCGLLAGVSMRYGLVRDPYVVPMGFPGFVSDYPLHVIESSPGHHHLIIEKALRWEEYATFLCDMADLGLVELGYVNASIARQMTRLRVHPATPQIGRAHV